MAQIICPTCAHAFSMNNPESFVTRGAAATAGGVAGAYIGAQVGIAGGPFGAFNGMWLGASLGGSIAWFAADQWRRCPKCGHIFKT
jgi:hypothetical protein